MTVVIDPIERKTLRPRTELGEELREGRETKLDAATAIMLPTRMMLIYASIFKHSY